MPVQKEETIEKNVDEIQIQNDSDPVQINENIRNYWVYITYDMYYHTPRFWLHG